MRLLKTKKIVMMKYASGEVRDIVEVKDKIFSEKMLGDGCFIIPNEKITKVKSPIKGKVTMIFETKHAVGIKTKNGIECLIHYGIDTVNLKGEGFKILVKVGDNVNFNNVIMKVDNEVIKSAGYENPIIVVFTDLNGYKIKKNYDSQELIEFKK
jgi:glucose-specific phosphotransferase system IIA component